MRDKAEVASIIGGPCGCWLLIVIFNVVLGGWSVDVLLALFDKDIPFWGDALIGLIVGEVTIPVALVYTILHYFGVL